MAVLGSEAMMEVGAMGLCAESRVRKFEEERSLTAHSLAHIERASSFNQSYRR